MLAAVLWLLPAIECGAAAPGQPAPEAPAKEPGKEAAKDGAKGEPADPALVAAKAGVELCLRDMEQAALKGDKAAWLACVDQRDSEFTHEQTYFANDLTKKKPEAITLSVEGLGLNAGGAGGEAGAGGAARGKVTFAWNMPGKRERRVAFDAMFIEHDGRWLYAGELWQMHEAAGVVVLCDPGLEELADRTVKAFERVRQKVEAGFELSESPLATHTQKIKLYGSMRHLQQSICLSYSDGLEGWNEPNESVKLLANKSSSVETLSALLAHEYGHVATFAMGPRANEMPWWVQEGVAELSREGAVGGDDASETVKLWAQQGRLADWKDLADFDDCPPKFHPFVYVQGHHMLGYISEQFGRHTRNQWLTLMAQGKTLDEATREAFGRGFEQLDKEWRESLPRAVGQPPLPEEKPAPKVPEPVKPEGAPSETPPVAVPGLDHPMPK